MAWELLVDGWKDEQTQSGVKVVRVYQNQKPEGLSLPAYGSSIGAAEPTDVRPLFVNSISKDKVGLNSSIENAVLNYGFPTINTTDKTFEELPRQLDIGGEMVSIQPVISGGAGNPWTWAGGVEEVPPDFKMFKRFATGSFQITEISTSLDEGGENSQLSRIIDNGGKVNATPFRGQPVANWLYMGAKAQEFYTEENKRAHRISHTFLFRKIGSNLAPDVTAGAWGWQLLRREDGEQSWWDRPENAESNSSLDQYIYEMADFGSSSGPFITSGVA